MTALELASTECHIAEEMTGITPITTSFEDYEHSGSDFAVILMIQILEHANDANAWISKAYNLLFENCVLVVAVPNFSSIFRYVMQKNDPYVCPPAHLNYFASNNLCLLLSRSGFKVQKIQWVSRIPRDSFARRLSMFGSPTVSVTNWLSGKLLRIINGMRVGMMLNVYAVKMPV